MRMKQNELPLELGKRDFGLILNLQDLQEKK